LHWKITDALRFRASRFSGRGLCWPDFTTPTIAIRNIASHPTDRDAAIHSLKCSDCGYEKTKVLSLRPAAPPPELTAKSIEESVN
jgi:hypothetical protein